MDCCLCGTAGGGGPVHGHQALQVLLLLLLPLLLVLLLLARNQRASLTPPCTPCPRVFDSDQSGFMDFEEFMLAANCTTLSDPTEKVRSAPPAPPAPAPPTPSAPAPPSPIPWRKSAHTRQGNVPSKPSTKSTGSNKVLNSVARWRHHKCNLSTISLLTSQ